MQKKHQGQHLIPEDGNNDNYHAPKLRNAKDISGKNQ